MRFFEVKSFSPLIMYQRMWNLGTVTNLLGIDFFMEQNGGSDSLYSRARRVKPRSGKLKDR